MAQALYRKYRSRSLGELVGQEHVTQTLANALKEGRISHAYLLTGLRGTGKTSIARILAHEINQLPYEDESTHLDIIEIDAASNNGVEDVRDLREKVMLAPTSAKYKVYIIDEVHMLSTAAFNALLKTLEEPPAHVVFILATTEVHKLPTTIISRTQRFQLQPIAKEKVIAHLKHIAKKEKITIDDDALALIAEHGDGAFRDSISLLDQLRSVSKEGITAETVEATLGLAPRTAIQQLVDALQAGEVQATVTHLEALLAKGIAAPALANQLIATLRPLTAQNPTLYTLIDKLIEVPRAYNPHLKLEVILATHTLNRDTSAPSQSPPTSSSGHKKEVPAQKPTSSSEPKSPQPTKAQMAGEEGFEPPNTGSTIQRTPTPTQEATTETTPTQRPATPEPETTQVHTPHAPGTPLGELTDEIWHAITETAKSVGPTLFTLIRQAIPHFDTEKQLLTITFRFPLHQKRLEEQKYKKDFAAILQNVWGGVPDMQVIVNKDAVKHIKPAIPHTAQNVGEAVSVDPAASGVLGVMGGGEIVNV